MARTCTFHGTCGGCWKHDGGVGARRRRFGQDKLCRVQGSKNRQHTHDQLTEDGAVTVLFGLFAQFVAAAVGVAGVVFLHAGKQGSHRFA